MTWAEKIFRYLGEQCKADVLVYLHVNFKVGDRITVNKMAEDMNVPKRELLMVLSDLVKEGWISWANIKPENPDVPIGKVEWVTNK